MEDRLLKTMSKPDVDGIERRHGGLPEFRHVCSEGGIDEYQLAANGLRLLIMQAPAFPVALLMVTYAVGSGHETLGYHGASHMLEHMMFKGSARFNKQLQTSIYDLLHPVGTLTNATTWLDRTNFFSLAPTSHLELVAEIEADRMCNLRIDAADLETERTVVLNEHDQYAGDPLEKLHQEVWSTAFVRHPYGKPVLGSRADIRGFTRDSLLQHYDRHYRPENAIVTVIGDVGRERVLQLVGRHFARVPRVNSPPRPMPAPEPEQCGERRVVLEQADRAGWVMLAYKSCTGLDEDADALELLGGILAGSKLSRLYRRLISTQLAAGAWSSFPRLKQPGLFQVQALLGASQDHQGVEKIIRDAIADLCQHGVTEQELSRAKGRARGNRLTSREGPLAIAMQLNEAIAAGDWRSYVRSLDRLDAVSTADVQRVARRYLTDECLTVGHLRQAIQPCAVVAAEAPPP
jgi:zinc protease